MLFRLMPAAAGVLLFCSAALAASPSPETDISAQLEQVQEMMLSDEGLMATILALQAEPEFQALMNDPELIAAAKAENVEAVLSHPKVRKFLENPRVREIEKRLEADLGRMRK